MGETGVGEIGVGETGIGKKVPLRNDGIEHFNLKIVVLKSLLIPYDYIVAIATELCCTVERQL